MLKGQNHGFPIDFRTNPMIFCRRAPGRVEASSHWQDTETRRQCLSCSEHRSAVAWDVWDFCSPHRAPCFTWTKRVQNIKQTWTLGFRVGCLIIFTYLFTIFEHFLQTKQNSIFHGSSMGLPWLSNGSMAARSPAAAGAWRCFVDAVFGGDDGPEQKGHWTLPLRVPWRSTFSAHFWRKKWGCDDSCFHLGVRQFLRNPGGKGGNSQNSPPPRPTHEKLMCWSSGSLFLSG